ncbi:MAG TPA: Hpt domain-containing protein [Gemmatimonadales bacterium]|nr:Hpt domain-containing protein [Gemmatimonadales bacterium]
MTVDPGAPWPPVDLPVLDRAALDTLRDLEDDDSPDLMSETAEIFLEDANARLVQLEQATASVDLEAMRRVAHALKGASLVMGARRLAVACGGLESAARDAHPDAASVWWARIAIEYELAGEAIREEMRSGGGR